jgi:hypothetical protein
MLPFKQMVGCGSGVVYELASTITFVQFAFLSDGDLMIHSICPLKKELGTIKSI